MKSADFMKFTKILECVCKVSNEEKKDLADTFAKCKSDTLEDAYILKTKYAQKIQARAMSILPELLDDYTKSIERLLYVLLLSMPGTIESGTAFDKQIDTIADMLTVYPYKVAENIHDDWGDVE